MDGGRERSTGCREMPVHVIINDKEECKNLENNRHLWRYHGLELKPKTCMLRRVSHGLHDDLKEIDLSLATAIETVTKNLRGRCALGIDLYRELN
jgi:hypothetical protein